MLHDMCKPFFRTLQGESLLCDSSHILEKNLQIPDPNFFQKNESWISLRTHVKI
ncbi:hypothetical protein LEP1GSC013_3794 [Leptospira interrogans serovar Valbuzzi str. Duyster]|nr:hypothetical protein LEP1GSC013_3794 [Leptospira interrogans serovar Valbuzzi str. Duyster]ENO70092.1 hypothetical protein LEP1GSC012_0164 [Leptospira interrogans serovar Valbuzzi str. Valbuzzi]